MTDDVNVHDAIKPKRAAWWYIATWFGAGLSPIMSGTAGSLAALPFAYVIQLTLGNAGLWFCAFVMFGVGWWASHQYLKHMGGDDPREIVVDEVAGLWLTLSLFPLTWQGYLIGFILFRALDIIKPWPVSWADQKVEGGAGVMLDDLLAGAYPIAILFVLITISQLFGVPRLVEPLMIFMLGAHV